MSEVWLAKHKALATPVVIKTLRRHLRHSTPDAAAARIVSQARLMARVSSPRIVRALDAGHVVDQGETTPFLVQEYVDGLDFAELDGRRRGCARARYAVAVRLPGHARGVPRAPRRTSGWASAPGLQALQRVRRARARDPARRLRDRGRAQREHPPRGRRHPGVHGARAAEERGRRPLHGRVGRGRHRVRFPLWPSSVREPRGNSIRTGRRGSRRRSRRRRPTCRTSSSGCSRRTSPIVRTTSFLRSTTSRCCRRRRAETAPGGPYGSTLRLSFGRILLRFVVGDIAQAESDAIVSSANFAMRMRLGVGEALRRRGGDVIEEEATRNGEQSLGSCVRTGPGALAARTRSMRSAPGTSARASAAPSPAPCSSRRRTGASRSPPRPSGPATPGCRWRCARAR